MLFHKYESDIQRHRRKARSDTYNNFRSFELNCINLLREKLVRIKVKKFFWFRFSFHSLVTSIKYNKIVKEIYEYPAYVPREIWYICKCIYVQCFCSPLNFAINFADVILIIISNDRRFNYLYFAVLIYYNL